MKKTRFLSLLLALCLLGTALTLGACKKDPPPEEPTPPPPVTPAPEEPASFTEGSFTYYELSDGTWAVTASESADDATLSIPATFREKAVTQIGFAHPSASGDDCGFDSYAELTAVTVPASIKTIMPYAFSACTGLASVTFAEGSQLQSLGAFAFAECSALTAITLPEGLTSIGDAAFAADTALQSVQLPASLSTLGNNVFEECYKLLHFTNLSALTVTGLPDYTEVRTTTDTAFSTTVTASANGIQLLTANNQQYLYGYSGTQSVLDLSEYTFVAVFPFALAANKTVTELKLPASLLSIGTSAFAECSALTKLTFAEDASLEAIGVSAFESCRALTTLTLPDTLRTIDCHAFSGCENLSTLTIPASVTEIGEAAFAACSQLSTLTFAPDSTLSAIGGQAFLGCGALSAIALPATLTFIGDRAFADCLALERVDFGSTVGWQLTSADATPNLSNTANNAYYLTDLYVGSVWSKA